MRIFLRVLIFLAFCFVFPAAYGQTGDIDALYRQARIHYNYFRFEQAADIYLRAIEGYRRSENAKEPAEYLTNLKGLAETYIHLLQYKEHDLTYQTILKFAADTYGETSEEYADVLLRYHKSKLNRQVLEGVEEGLRSVMEIIKNSGMEYTPLHAMALRACGVFNNLMADYATARPELEKVAEILSSTIGPDSMEYASCLISLGTLSYNIEDYISALRYYFEAIEISYANMEKTEENVAFYDNYLLAYSMIGILHGSIGDYIEVENTLMEMLSLIETIYLDKHPQYIANSISLGNLYGLLGDCENGEPLLLHALDSSLEMFGENHPYHMSALNGLAVLYRQSGMAEKAESYFLRSLELRRKTYGDNHPSVAIALGNISSFYLQIEDYRRAEACLTESIEIFENILGEDYYPQSYIITLINLSRIKDYSGDKDNALLLLEKGVEAMNNAPWFNKHLLLSCRERILSFMISDENLVHEVEEAELLELVEERRDFFGENSHGNVVSLNTLARYYQQCGNFDKAFDIYSHCITITKKTALRLTDTYISLLFNAGINRECSGDIKNAYSYYNRLIEIIKEYIGIIKEYIGKDFAFLSEKERDTYWVNKNPYLDAIRDFAAVYGAEYPELGRLAYDAELFSRSLLLNSSRKVKESILNSGDLKLVGLWNELFDAKMNLGSLLQAYEKVTADDQGRHPLTEELSYRIEGLEREIENSEKELIRLSREYKLQQSDFVIDWKDIRNALFHGEAAVEIMIHRYGAMEINHYYALIIDSDADSPVILYLSDEKSIGEKQAGGISEALFNTVWKPVDEYLTRNKVSTVYLAPNGIISKVRFSLLRDNAGRYINDKYALRRLLSTKDILSVKAGKPNKNNYKTAVLFGDADYGLSSEETPGTGKGLFFNPVYDLMRSSYPDSVLLRYQGFDYLPGSREEVTALSRLLSRAGWETRVYIDTENTESRLKSLSGTHAPKLLHISTHGFYFEKEDHMAGKDTVRAGKVNIFSKMSDPLMRTGMLFSGANNAWTGQGNPINSDDGILTGYEIANLDFANTELVVLSACETGLADSDAAEGLYGLQRAFRLAGVDNIMVSLQKISDRETVEFMEEFYSHYSNGATAHESLDMTVRYLRERYSGQPQRWAGFVLIE